MNRLTEVLAVAGLLVTALVLYVRLTNENPQLMRKTTHDLLVIGAVLRDYDLHRRSDVTIKLDSTPVAAGFSRLDCDGLLLIAPLPKTAQSWGHLAPRLDLDSYAVKYTYAGDWYYEVPRLQRLVDRVVDDFRKIPASSRPRLVAVAESGECGLTAAVESALTDYSHSIEDLVLRHPVQDNSGST